MAFAQTASTGMRPGFARRVPGGGRLLVTARRVVGSLELLRQTAGFRSWSGHGCEVPYIFPSFKPVPALLAFSAQYLLCRLVLPFALLQIRNFFQ